MGSKGGTSSSSGFNFGTSTQTPDPQAMAAYQTVLGQAQNVGQIPYQPYGGQMVAGFTPDQLAAFQGVRETQGISQPYIQGAQGLVGQALSYADPSRFTAEELSRYYNPYQQNVIDATMANMREMNASQQNDLTGNAIMKGAMGGDRVGIARAELARQQNLTNNATLAGLQQQGWQNALNQYNQQQQTAIGAAQSGAYGLGQLGSQAQQSALQGLQALLGTGGMQQALGQQQLQNAYEQWQQAMGYPYQHAQWQAGITGAIAPSMGGTTTSMGFGSNTQQQPQPSVGNQVAGLGLAGLSLLPKIYKDGGRVGKADGGYFDVLSLPTDDPGLPNVWGPQGLDQIARERWVSANADGELDGDAVMRADGGPLNMPLSAKREMYARSFVPAMELSAARPSFPTAPKIDVPQPHGGGGDGGLMGGLTKGLGSLSKEQAGGIKEGLGRLIGSGQPITLAGAMPGSAVGDVVIPEKDIGFGGIYADGGRVELADGGSPYAGWLDRSMPTGVAGSSLAPQIPSSSVFEPRQSLPSPIASSQGGGGMNPMMLMGMMGGGGSGGMSGMLPLLMMQQQQQAAQAAQADADREAQRGDVLSQPRSPVGYAPTSLNYGQIDPMTGLYSVRGWSPYYMAPYADGGAVERRGYFRGAAVEDEREDIDKYLSALAKGESGGEKDPYLTVGASSRTGDKPYGKYQVMGANVPVWSQEAGLGKLSPQEFLSNPDAQETVARHKFGEYLRKAGSPEKAAAMWFGGPGYASHMGARDALGTSIPEYMRRYTSNLGSNGSPLAYAAAEKPIRLASAETTANDASPLHAPSPAPAAASERTGLGSMWSPEVQQGLLAAGLGMMASRSPNFGTALGEGGLRGMQVYNSALENTRDAEKQKLAQSRLDANQALEAAKFAEEKRWHDLQAKQREDKTPALIREYEYAKEQGYGGDFNDFRQATRPQTNVSISGDKAYEQTVGKGYGETMLDLQKSGRSAPSAITSLNLLEKATQTPGYYSGSAEPVVNAARKAAVALGVADAATAAPNEIFAKISNKLVLDLAGGSLGTGFSNADRDYLAGTVPNLSNTPEGNRQIIGLMKAVEGRKIEIAKLAREYAKANNGQIDAGFDGTLAQWAEANPLFKAAPAAPEKPALKAPPADLMNEARSALKSGKDRAAVTEKMRSLGFDPSGL